MSEAAPPAEADDGLPTPRRTLAAAAILAAIVLAVLDGAIANVALPSLSAALAVSSSASIWVVTGYQMALVVALLPCAALGESLGYRRVFTAGVMIFTAASGLCALAPTLPWLVLARVLQGLGAAAVMSLLAALLRFTYPRRLLGTAIGLNATVVALSAATGPTLGALILSVASWPWLFAVNVPIGLLVLAASRALPGVRGHGRPLDGMSVALNAGFFAPLVVGVDLLTTHPGAAAALLGLAALSLFALVRRELPRPAPLIPLDLLRGGTFRYSVVASVCCFAAQMVSYVALPFYLQHGLGRDPLTTGLYMTPWPLTVALAAPVSGRFADRVPTAWLCAAGGLCLACGLTLAATWRLEGHITPLIGFTMLAGLGFGFFQTPNNRNMLLSAPVARSGAAGGMQATARQCGQAAGAVIMALLFTVAPSGIAPRIGLGVGAALALAGGLVSLMRVGR
ncbi:MFS transporter [Lichenibacterium ramalinae]|uniref:MFS transporter n=1 Tax=Lichenibacterium ramalinae TaxID=2316527 RepID=A0A4Q2RHG6_9HYPH|nr:MFS transporter [Lichenibacterium ramalinae]RYB07939.1 MFS transporter [Lichenibacterium ramalinae]